MTFHITEGLVFGEKSVLRRAKPREFTKACTDMTNEQILALIFGIQNEDKLFQSQESNCV